MQAWEPGRAGRTVGGGLDGERGVQGQDCRFPALVMGRMLDEGCGGRGAGWRQQLRFVGHYK